MEKRFTVFFLFLLFSLATGACESRHVAERPAIPDTTRPTIVSISPAVGATAVLVNAAVTVTFSEAMNASTVNNTSFLLSSPTGVIAGTVTYDPASNVVTFTPNSVLEHSVLYTATITTDATDIAGNAIGSSYSWSFTTIPSPGTLDSTLGANGRVRMSFSSGNDYAFAAAIQLDGKIVTAGYSAVVTSVTGTIPTITNYFTIARFQTNGALDTDFNSPFESGKNDYFTGRAFAVALQADGKIVAAGSSGDSNSSDSDFMIARYNADGTRDTSFGTQTIPDGSSIVDMGGTRDLARALAIQQTNGYIIVTGESTTNNGVTYQTAIARLKTDGTLDSTFGTEGKIINSTYATSHAYLVKIQSDEMILVGGIVKNVDETTEGLTSSYIMRYDPTGTLDPSFGSSGLVTVSTGTNTFIKAMEILRDGKIIVAGTTTITTENLFLMRFNSDGSPDTSFGSNFNGIVITTDDVNKGEETAAGLAIQTDGKIIVAATYLPTTGSSPTNDFALFRYSANGALDTTFGSGGFGLVITDFGSDDFAECIQIQQDGKVVVVGLAFNNSNFDIGLARYWP